MKNIATLTEELFKDEALKNVQTTLVFAYKTKVTKVHFRENRFVLFKMEIYLYESFCSNPYKFSIKKSIYVSARSSKQVTSMLKL